MTVPFLGLDDLVRLALILVTLGGIGALSALGRRRQRDRAFDEAYRRLLREERESVE